METQLIEAHDSTLIALEAQWQTGIFKISLKFHNEEKHFFIDNVSSLTMKREFEWGESYQVNNFLIRENGVEIEMQSGDLIVITGMFRH